MPPIEPSSPPPTPDDLASFEDLTARLRELFAWCGTPKYVAMSQLSGLAPSAISGLIGKRASRHPSQSSTLRFVTACLRRGGVDAADIDAQVEAWRTAWRRLDEQVETAAQPSARPEPNPTPAPAPTSAPARMHRRPALVVAAAVVAVALVAAGVLGLTRRGSGSSAAGGAPRSVCERVKISEANDVRNARLWDTAFQCPNRVGAEVHLLPQSGSPVVSQMKLPRSWFVCWTRGKKAPGGNAIWYYTQGDVNLDYPKVHSWGYVSSGDLDTEEDPDPKAFRRCPSPTPAL